MQGDPVGCQSEIKIKFGQCEGMHSSGISVDLAVEFNSTKVENKRFNISEYLNIEIPSNSFLIELQAKSDVQDVIGELQKFRENSQSFKYMKNQMDFIIQFAGKEKFVYIILKSEQIQQAIKKINKKIEGEVGPEGQRWVEGKLLSKNSLYDIKKLTEKKGFQRAVLSSLLVDIKFKRVEFIQKIIKNKIKNIFGDGLSELVTSVEDLNLNLSFDSSDLIDNMKSFPSNSKPIEINDDFKSLQSLLGNKLTFYAFGKPLSLTAKVTGEDLYLILDILLA